MKRVSRKSIARVTRAAIVATIVQGTAAATAQAADATWNVSGSGTSVWNLDTNWLAGAAPGVSDGGVTTNNPDTATFGNIVASGSTRVVTVDTDRNVFGINFAGNSGVYQLTGGSLLLSNGGIIQTSGGGSIHTDSIASAITLQGNGGGFTFATNSTTVGRILSISSTIAGVSTAGNTTTLTLTGGGTSSSNALTNALSDGGAGGKLAIVKNGTGTWTLSGVNSGMSGIFTLNDGVLNAQNTANTTNVLQALGTGDLYLNGGTLNLRGNGTGSSQVIAVGTNLFVGSNAVTVDVNRFNGSNTGSSFSFASANLGSGTLNVTGSNSYSMRVLGTTTLAANVTVNPSTGGLALMGTVTDNGSGYSLTKNGAATLTLSVANTYSGGTTLNAGRLVVGNNGALGTGGLAINGGHLTVGSTNPFITINSGTPITLGGSFTVLSAISTGMNTGVTNNITLANNVAISGGIDGYGSTFNLSGVISDGANTFGISINSAGANPASIQLGGNNDFGGGVTLNGGTLRIAHNNALGSGTFTINGGTVTAAINNLVLGGISQQIWAGDFGFTNNAGNVNLGEAPVTLQGAVRSVNINNVGASVGGIISGAGSQLRYTSTQYNSSLSLTGNNTFDGGVVVVAGTGSTNLVAGHANAFGTGPLILSSASTSKATLSTNLTVAALDSAITAPTIAAGGSGYVPASTTVTISGGGGTGATANATVTSGAIAGITITNYGTGYTSTPTFTINGVGINAVVNGNFAASSVVLNANTLTLTGANSSPATYSGVISGTGHLVKQGAGSQTLTGVNTYGGATTVTGGLLRIANAGSINAGSGVNVNGGTLQYDSSVALTKAVTFGANGGSFIYNEYATGYSGGALNVGAGALLGGSGKIAGNATINSGGKLSPGDAAGVLTVTGNLNLSGATGDVTGGALIFRIGTVNSDQVIVNGTLEVGTLDFADFDIANNGSLVNGTYVLFDAASQIGGSIGNATGSFSAFFDGTLSIDNENGNYNVVLTVTPEPASLSLVIIGAAGLLARRRRRKN